MFNKRKRSYRKGPPANQIYVPHDQRQLNPNPIPIMTEKQAQFYYRQLKDMGYIPPQQEQDYQIFKIATTDDSYGIKFEILDDQSIQWYGSLPQSLNVYDIDNQPMDPKYADQINKKLSMNGYKLYPGKLFDTPVLYNHSSDENVPIIGMYNNNSSSSQSLYTYTLQPGHNQSWNYITTALISRVAVSYVYLLDCDNNTDYSTHVGCVKISCNNAGTRRTHIGVKSMEIIAVKT